MVLLILCFTFLICNELKPQIHEHRFLFILILKFQSPSDTFLFETYNHFGKCTSALRLLFVFIVWKVKFCPVICEINKDKSVENAYQMLIPTHRTCKEQRCVKYMFHFDKKDLSHIWNLTCTILDSLYFYVEYHVHPLLALFIDKTFTKIT